MTHWNNVAGGTLPPRFFSHGVETLPEMEALNTVAYIPIEFHPINKGPVHLSVIGARSDAVSVWMTASSTGFRSTPKEALDVLTIRMPLRGAMLRRDSRNEFECRPGIGLLLPFDQMRDFRSSGDLEMVSCTIGQATIQRYLLALQGDEANAPIEFLPIVSLDTLPLRTFAFALRAFYHRMLVKPAEGDLFFPLLEEMLICQLLSAWPHNQAQEDTPRAPSRALRLAMDYIDANLARPITVSEIARASGTSIRSIQRSFRADLACRPTQYIVDERLKRVHQDLVDAGRTKYVSEIAHRWGFVHLSVFSRLYRKKFGVLPSVTRRS